MLVSMVKELEFPYIMIMKLQSSIGIQGIFDKLGSC
jgi:hypothetical protein